MPLLQKVSFNAWVESTEEAQPPTWYAMDSQDLVRVISSCPNLQEVNLHGVMPEGSDFTALLQLPSSCTRLDVGGWGFTDAAAPVVAQLMQLKHLEWANRPGLTDSGLVQLTALGTLSHLVIADCKALSNELHTETWGGIELMSRESELPVCMQLEDLCALSHVLNAEPSAEPPAELPTQGADEP